MLAGGAIACMLMLPVPAAAQPDVRQMSGMPLPVTDVPAGTVSVRVVKGTLTNVIANQTVTLVGGGDPKTVQTNDTGRAEFTGLPPGTRVKAVADVAGERLESQEFQVPATGGIRLLLVATDPALAKQAAEDQKLAQAPAQRGTVVLGQESRLVIEMGEDGLNVFNILQIVNAAKTPVQTDAPIVFGLPENAEHAAVLQGSSPQAVAAGKQVTVTGPFAPGPTVVQFAYTIPLTSGNLTIQQTLPVAMTQLTVMAQKVGAMHLTSPQFSQHRDMASEGQTYVLGHGPALKAGDTIALNFTGLPHESTWPRTVAVTLAFAIIAAGAWAALRARRGTSEAAARRSKLQTRRDRLFAQLTELEERHRARQIAAGDYQARRRELVSALEEIYAEIDNEAAA